MARINLLPWREERRKERQRQFLGMLVGFALLAGAIVLYVHMHIGWMIDDQEARNNYLNQEIAILDKKIKEIQELEKEKARLLAHMKIIQELQANRPVVVHLFDEMVKTIPEGVFYNNLERRGTTLTMRGVAESNTRVSALMRNTEASDWVTSPKLNIIETKRAETARESNFILQVQQKQQGEAAADGGGAKR
ncbi:PilN domain-containing protein [Thioalbus denitrificans]|uniref:Type IV pilus assembly protein PilN n=1 Tax=Thioalbus denitrificans TaxID=547122 RepID=A0A369CH78_9GAMM|nr:PilN domain-containing protein [Thioalbus denitrificans]RCX32931.1 type IV pilus assembly protein PilN [Thioalbus denitrificans]